MRNAEAQAPALTARIKICILTRFPGDSGHIKFEKHPCKSLLPLPGGVDRSESTAYLKCRFPAPPPELPILRCKGGPVLCFFNKYPQNVWEAFKSGPTVCAYLFIDTRGKGEAERAGSGWVGLSSKNNPKGHRGKKTVVQMEQGERLAREYILQILLYGSIWIWFHYSVICWHLPK